jgi:tripartite-type tricarboxylate transporter receptor subunit TctC
MHRNTPRHLRQLALTACVALSLAVPLQAAAQVFPTKPLKILNGFAAGGSSDIVARFIAQKMSEGLGQPVIVEPKPGAGGVIANDYVAKQAPDGHTLLIVTGAYPVQAALLKKLPFDPVKDLAFISSFTFYPFVVNVATDSRFKTMEEFLRYAKANPGKLNYASNGIGTVHQFAAELFNAMSGAEMAGIPFKGGTQAMTELIAGRVDVLFETMTFSVPLIQGGRLRPLAVTAPAPVPALPNVPTVAQYLPGYEVASFLGIAATGGTPPAVIERLNKEVRRIMALPDIHQRFLDLGGEPKPSSPEEMKQFVEREIVKWKGVIQARKIEQQ